MSEPVRTSRHPTAKAQDVSQLFDGTASWADVEWIGQTWTGPLALKGVLSEQTPAGQPTSVSTR